MTSFISSGEGKPREARGAARKLGEWSTPDIARSTSRRLADGDEAEGEAPKEALVQEERQGVMRWASERALGSGGTTSSPTPTGNSRAAAATHDEFGRGNEALRRRSIACETKDRSSSSGRRESTSGLI